MVLAVCGLIVITGERRLIEGELLYYRGRVALAELLLASGVQEGDNIAIQAFTCSAVPEGVFAANAKPLYIDVTKRGATMCPDDLLFKLKSSVQVKAVIIQHTFGLVADVEKIIEIAKRFNLIVIEDCCHTLNSKFKNRKVGGFSDASFYSFEWGKPVSLGLGGAVQVTNKKLLATLKGSYTNFVNPSISTELQLFIQRVAFLRSIGPVPTGPLSRCTIFLLNTDLLKVIIPNLR